MMEFSITLLMMMLTLVPLQLTFTDTMECTSGTTSSKFLGLPIGLASLESVMFFLKYKTPQQLLILQYNPDEDDDEDDDNEE